MSIKIILLIYSAGVRHIQSPSPLGQRNVCLALVVRGKAGIKGVLGFLDFSDWYVVET